MGLKIIIISPYQFRLKRGIERFTYSLANKLAQQGVSVTIYTWGSNAETVQWGKWETCIKIRKVPATRYYQSFLAGIFYRYWMKKDRSDIVVLNFLYHGEQQLPLNKKYLYILNTPASEVPRRYAFIKKQINRFKSIQFVAVSQMVLREALPYLNNKPVSVIFNGVDTHLFVPVTNPTVKGRDKIKIITAAALEERKGIQHLLTFLGKCNYAVRQKITYEIYGEGNYKDSLVKLIDQYHLHDCVTIHSPVNNLQEVLPRYDLFCLMSHGEAMPMAPLEAMACGLPVLCADVPPFDEFISPDIGLVVNPDDHDSILRFILQFQDSATAKKFSDAARKKSLQYSWNIVADKYLDLLNEFSAPGLVSKLNIPGLVPLQQS